MSRRLTLLCVALAFTLIGTAQAQNELFPNTTELGGAAIQYKDDAVHLVAATTTRSTTTTHAGCSSRRRSRPRNG